MVALEHDDPIAFSEVGPRVNVFDDADAFMSKVHWIIMELEIVRRPDPRALQANRRNLGT
jgi:hypothetical protein